MFLSSVVSCNTNADLFQELLNLLQRKYFVNLDFVAKILRLHRQCLLVTLYVRYSISIQTTQEFLVASLRASICFPNNSIQLQMTPIDPGKY